MNFVHFTTPDGKPVSIRTDQIVGLKPNDGSFHKDARTVIVLGGGVQAVREAMQDVEKALSTAG